MYTHTHSASTHEFNSHIYSTHVVAFNVSLQSVYMVIRVYVDNIHIDRYIRTYIYFTTHIRANSILNMFGRCTLTPLLMTFHSIAYNWNFTLFFVFSCLFCFWFLSIRLNFHIFIHNTTEWFVYWKCYSKISLKETIRLVYLNLCYGLFIYLNGK